MSRIVKTVITVTVLHETHGLDTEYVYGMDLAEIAEFIDTGAGIGDKTVVSNKVLDVGDVRQELLALGNDGTFFDLTEVDGYDFGPLPVVITLDRKDAKPGERASDFIGRFATEDIASSFLSLSATIDPDDLHEGRYGICTMAKGEFCDDEPVMVELTNAEAAGLGPIPGTIVRQLTAKEADPEGGPMYAVRYEDGAVGHAFGFEITPVATELPDGIDI